MFHFILDWILICLMNFHVNFIGKDCYSPCGSTISNSDVCSSSSTITVFLIFLLESFVEIDSSPPHFTDVTFSISILGKSPVFTGVGESDSFSSMTFEVSEI